MTFNHNCLGEFFFFFLRLPENVTGELPALRFSADWLGNRSAFHAGDTATIVINVTEFNSSRSTANFSLSIEGIKGNSSYVSDVISYSNGDLDCWNIAFVPLWAGEFSAVLTEENSRVPDSSLSYLVTPGMCS